MPDACGILFVREISANSRGSKGFIREIREIITEAAQTFKKQTMEPAAALITIRIETLTEITDKISTKIRTKEEKRRRIF